MKWVFSLIVFVMVFGGCESSCFSQNVKACSEACGPVGVDHYNEKDECVCRKMVMVPFPDGTHAPSAVQAPRDSGAYDE